ncbi:efflux RND transporter periplasmic adaptor subunit [Nitratireductor indicus]|uniref:efflux RND transporter periplasmic adaptor subunit n=1 Tax=Nitratireductor indicus TaxID=721133 RepID=UPI002874A1CA|nr:efflux RND transporter periplasmic adaptor subunit [Nitratireductor indicus]MDS1138045.1 efflux RND transporter periplasmic adaptor subunit [Nitratireductor indicus]
MKKTTRITLSLIALAAIAIGGYFYWQQRAASQDQTYLTASVTRGDVELTVLASGTLKPVKLVAVGAQVSGRITSVDVELGQTVKAGDRIAEIDSVTQENALRTAQAALANTKAQKQEKEATLALKEQTLERQKQMLAKSAVSRADYDSAVAEVSATKAQIAALDALIVQGEVAIETAEANLGYTRITAPIDGTVLAIVSQEGQTVNASQSAPTIVVLGQLDTMTVRTEISEADIIKVKAGQSLWFTILGEPGKRYEAMLDSIEPAPESITSDRSIVSSSSSSYSSSSSSDEAIYYNGIFNVPNPDGHLRTYMTAEVHIVLGEARNVLTIPASALGGQDSEGRYSVRVLDRDGTVSSRQVEIGLNDRITAEIRSGLEEGDRVITSQSSQQTNSGSSQRMGPPPMGL